MLVALTEVLPVDQLIGSAKIFLATLPVFAFPYRFSFCSYRARDAWGSLPNLRILGNLQVERLPVFSFLIHHPATGYFLHHNFVACLLNDLFGIQARGGCACAGPYAMDLLGISEEQAMQIEDLLIEQRKPDKKNAPPVPGESQREIFKPGFTRLNLPYFIREEQLEFVFQAVAMVAEHGWKLLPQYKFNPKTGEWKHELSQESKQQRRFEQLSYENGFLEVRTPKSPKESDESSLDYQECLATARQIFADAEKAPPTVPDQSHFIEEFARPSRWFLLPSEASEVLKVLSHISHLGPARQFIIPKNSHTGGGLLGGGGHPKGGPSSSSSSMNSGSGPSPSTTVTHLGGSDAGNPWNKTGNGSVKPGKGNPTHVQRIKVTGQSNNQQQSKDNKWKL